MPLAGVALVCVGLACAATRAPASGQEGLRQIPARVVETVRMPADGVRGLAVRGRTLWLLATRNRGLAAPDSSFTSRILVMDLDGGGATTLATDTDSYESGLAWDGSWLWAGGSLVGGHAGIYRLDPTSGATSATLPSSGFHPGGLTASGGYLWQVDCDTRKLYRIEPAEGKVSRKLSTPGFYPTGVAHDGSRFWCADAASGRLYRLRGFNAEPEGVVERSAFDRPGEFVSLAWDSGSLWVVGATDSVAVRLDVGR